MHFVKILIHLQPVVILSLVIAFILVFGLPAYQKYISYEVYIKETHIEEEALTAPAMTICVEMVRNSRLYMVHNVMNTFQINSISVKSSEGDQ